MSKRDERSFVQAMELISDRLGDAVQRTIEERSPEPSRECIDWFAETDRQALSGEESGQILMATTFALLGWATLVRTELADRPGLVEEVLVWIEDTLGKRYRARARYTSGVLRSEAEADEALTYAEALRDDFLPSLIWLLAGAVALHGNGEVEWLRGLQVAASTSR